MPAPSSEQLRFFDVAARLLSFQAAASELNVTPAAVSQRIRGLEDNLQCQLFTRHTRRISLTTEGRMLADKTRQAFALLQDAIQQLQQLHQRQRLTISTTTTFAEQFLMTRLAEFQQQFPDADSRILVSNSLVDFSQDQVDFAVRQGLGNYSGMNTVSLGNDLYVAVASPQLAAGFAGNSSSDTSLSASSGASSGVRSTANCLISVDWPAHLQDIPDWSQWFAQQACAAEPGSYRYLQLPTEALAIRAALNHQGVALVHSLHVHEELNDGRLVAVKLSSAPQRLLSSPYRYYLVWPEGTSATGLHSAFIRWLTLCLTEDRKTQSLPAEI